MIVITILLWLLLSIAVFFCIIVFSPFQARLRTAFDGCCFSGRAQFSFIHPAVVRVAMNFSDRTVNFRIFGRQPGKRKKDRQQSPVSGEPPQQKTGSGADHGDDSFRPRTSESSIQRETQTDTGFSNVQQGQAPASEQKTPDILFRPYPADVIKESADAPTPAEKIKPVRRTSENRRRAKGQTSYSSKTEETLAPRKKKKDNWIEKIKRSIVFHFLSDRRWRSRVIGCFLGFLKALFRIVRFDELRMEIRAGVENPMVTGTVSGYACALKSILSGNDRYLFSFEPVFMQNFLAGSLGFRMRTSIASLLFPVVAAIVLFPWIRTLLIFLKYRREKKRCQRLAVT